MALVSVASGTQVVSIGSEHSLVSSSGIGVYMLSVDTSDMQAGDTLEIRINSKLISGESFKLAYLFSFTDAQIEVNKYSIPIPIVVEVNATLKQTAGTGRSYKWSMLRL